MSPGLHQRDAEARCGASHSGNIVGVRRKYLGVVFSFPAALSDEAIEATWGAEQHVAHRRAADVHQLMWNATLEEQRLTGTYDLCFAADDRLHLTLHHIDGFVIIGVDVDGRPRCAIAAIFEETELSTRLGAGQQPLHEHAGQHKFFDHDFVFLQELSRQSHGLALESRGPSFW